MCARAVANSFVSLISVDLDGSGSRSPFSVLIVVLSVVNGFERELKDRLLAMTAHASIEGTNGSLDAWQAGIFCATRPRTMNASAPPRRIIDGKCPHWYSPAEQLSGVPSCAVIEPGGSKIRVSGHMPG
jgi:hypothetical protein